MRSSLPLKAAASVAALAAMAACSDVSPTAPRTLRPTSNAAGDFIPTLSQTLITTGTFLGYTANESLRDGPPPTEFWDNLSSDDRPRLDPALGDPHSIATTHCNVGFYASGADLSACAFTITGSSVPSAGIYTTYLQDAGTGADDAAPFAFSAAYKYNVQLKASYRGGNSEVGYFYVDGTGRHYQAVAAFSADPIDPTVTTVISLPAGTTSWGFYISQPALTGDAVNCRDSHTVCSDQTANQHFALFASTNDHDYIVGVEDANLTPLWPASEPPNGNNEDSDYQDYIFTVVPQTVVETTTWCSPGFWKNNGRDLWTAHQGELYSSLSALNIDGFPAPLSKKAPAGDPTLLQVIDNPSVYGGPATNSVSDYLSNLAFGTPIGSGVESCPGPSNITPF